jgi:prepilin-type N-terminal cleavage/methylation domain-containing protein/prepilin-type processing-associated H-X9-DG protein
MKRGFTLIELLVVISVIALLLGILLPALGAARGAARSAVCLSSTRQIGIALGAYNADNQDCVLPSYNMTGTGAGVDTLVDGWAPILDRDAYIPGNRANAGSVFTCPEVVDVEGMATGQTGTDPLKPRGWMDWPNIRNGSGVGNVATTIPATGFNRIIRAAYWINSNNPIGTSTAVANHTFFTASVGYGPGSNGVTVVPTRFTMFTRPSQLIALADGLYAGKQAQNRLGVTDSRIGYRHAGPVATANTTFADGHSAPIAGDAFPRGGVAADNTGPGPTLYANPAKFFP